MNNYRKLKKQPLKVVIAEVRYTDILSIDEHMPKFQESIRKDFPILLNGSRQEVRVEGNEITLVKKPTHNFLSSDKTSGIEIGESRIVFFTKDYNRFKGFKSAIEKVIYTAEEFIRPSLLTRIGLRYSNTIEVDKGSTLNDYFDDEFKLPLKVGNSGKVAVHKNETQTPTSDGVLLIRRVTGKTSASIFKDLASMPIVFHETENKLKAFLDIDHSYEASEDGEFDSNFVLSKIESLHKTIRSSFWVMTTKFAREEKWK